MKKLFLWIVLAIACLNAKSNPSVAVSDFERYSQQMSDLSSKYIADKQFENASKVIDIWLASYEKTTVSEKVACNQIYATILYNQACAYAQTNELFKALKALNESVKKGYSNKAQLENDVNLLPLKLFDEYKMILKKMKS